MDAESPTKMNEPTNDDDKMKLYTLYSTAPYNIVRDVAVLVASRFGHVTELSETPDGAIVVVPRRIWGAVRWRAVFVALTGSPLFFHYVWPTASNLQGFGLGWILAGVIFLARRNNRVTV
jgi:hypothetical protein